MFFCDPENTCSWFITNDQGYLNRMMMAEMLNDLLGITPGSGSKNGDMLF